MREETRIQRAIRQYIAARGYASIHVPNGATLRGDKAQRERQMASLKADGLMPGFPDLIVYGPGQRIGHIEVKTDKGRQTDTQKACEVWLTGLEHKYAVCRSVNDAARALNAWGWR